MIFRKTITILAKNIAAINGSYSASAGEISAGYNYDKRFQSVNWEQLARY